MFSATDLVVAPATVAGPAARGIVRLAGDGLDRLLRLLFVAEPPGFAAGGTGPRVVAARLSATGLGREWGELAVDVLHWPGPGGPVGGPLAEVQLPGSVPLVEAVVAEACRHGARLARGGEFTLRAFLAGKLDLVQAEAVVAVVDARSPAELRSALDRLAGGAGTALQVALAETLDLLADIEAAIDFADEATPDAVPVGPAWEIVAARIAGCEAAVARVAADLAGRDAAATDLPLVVLAGPPNIGKSSLFNALLGRPAALVADETGTTRDWLEACLGDPGGPCCRLVDLPGLGGCDADDAYEPDDAIARAARARARDVIERAEVVLACRDAAGPVAAGAFGRAARIDVVTRCDRAAPAGSVSAAPPPGEPAAISTSSHTGVGIDRLRAAILEAVGRLPRGGSPATLRLAVGCDSARAALAAAGEAAAVAARGGFVDESLVALRLRQAVDALGEVTGAAIGTDLLDRIFSRHCIGK